MSKINRETASSPLGIFIIYVLASAVVVLAYHFIAHYSQEYNRDIAKISEEGIQKLLAYPWSGNVRELENTIARAVIDSAGEQTELTAENISFLTDIDVSENHNSENTKEEIDRFLATFSNKNRRYKELFAEWEKAMVKSVWNQEKKNKTKTAERLGISVRSLFQKIRNHHLD